MSVPSSDVQNVNADRANSFETSFCGFAVTRIPRVRYPRWKRTKCHLKLSFGWLHRSGREVIKAQRKYTVQTTRWDGIVRRRMLFFFDLNKFNLLNDSIIHWSKMVPPRSYVIVFFVLFCVLRVFHVFEKIC